jgi:O-antigen/teichoic acid export membrane protein
MLRIRDNIRELDWAFIRRSSVNSLGIAVARVLGFAFSFVIAQAFSSDEYGRVVYVITLASVVAVFSQPFGQHVLAYFIGKYHEADATRHEILASAWSVWVGLIGLTLLVSTPILWALDRFRIELFVVYIGITIFYTYTGTARGFLASTRLLAAYTGSNVVQIILVVLAVTIFDIENGTPAIIIYGLSYFLPLGILVFFFPLPIRVSFGFNLVHIRRILEFSTPIWISHILYMGYFASDVILLERLLDDSAVGVYGLTKTLSSAFHFIPGGITMILMPKIAGMPKVGHRSILKTSLLVTLGVNLIGGLLYMVLYRWFVITFFGAEYFGGLNFALVMALAAILFGIHGVITAVFVGSGHVSYLVVSRGIMMFSIIVLGLTLIPEYGIMGAATASLISVILGGAFYLLILGHEGFTAHSVESMPALKNTSEG